MTGLCRSLPAASADAKAAPHPTSPASGGGGFLQLSPSVPINDRWYHLSSGARLSSVSAASPDKYSRSSSAVSKNAVAPGGDVCNAGLGGLAQGLQPDLVFRFPPLDHPQSFPHDLVGIPVATECDTLYQRPQLRTHIVAPDPDPGPISGPLDLPRRRKRSVAGSVRPVTAGCARLSVQGWAPDRVRGDPRFREGRRWVPPSASVPVHDRWYYRPSHRASAVQQLSVSFPAPAPAMRDRPVEGTRHLLK